MFDKLNNNEITLSVSKTVLSKIFQLYSCNSYSPKILFIKAFLIMFTIPDLNGLKASNSTHNVTTLDALNMINSLILTTFPLVIK